jgi:RHS repeat-associated protein
VDTSAYKASLQVTRVSLPNTSFITNTYDTVGRQLTTILKNSGGTVLNSHSYVVNTAWQRTKQTRTDGGYVNYTYDNASELREGLTFTAANAAVNAENYKFGYNEGQNMTKRTNNTTVTTYTVNNLNQVTGDGTYTFSYDNNGNRTGKIQTGSVFYTYDDENQLTQAETDTSQTPVAMRWRTQWEYDARGRMRKRTEYSFNTITGWVLSSETRYLYDGRRVIQERNSSNVPLVTYVRGLDLSGSFEGAGGIGGMLSRTAHTGANGVTLTHAFYHADANGNITKMIDNSQASVADYKYDPFGRTFSSSGTLATANSYRFSSKELMGPSGFYYYGFRFYDPETQRWPNRDPLGEEGGINLYQFSSNDPTDLVDPFGLSPSLNPANQAMAAECVETASASAGRVLADALRPIFGQGLKASRNIDVSKLKALNPDQIKRAAEIAKGGMRKASEMFKKASDPNTSNAAVNAFETQLNRYNACMKALGK